MSAVCSLSCNAVELTLISEKELCKVLGAWMLDNSRAEFVPAGASREDYLDAFCLPHVQYVHTQTCLDANGDAVTALKAVIALSDWQTRNGAKSAGFTFYKIIKTLSAAPDSEPELMGYIVV